MKFILRLGPILQFNNKETDLMQTLTILKSEIMECFNIQHLLAHCYTQLNRSVIYIDWYQYINKKYHFVKPITCAVYHAKYMKNSFYTLNCTSYTSAQCIKIVRFSSFNSTKPKSNMPNVWTISKYACVNLRQNLNSVRKQYPLLTSLGYGSLNVESVIL